jgi:hypothetical protein
VVASTSATYRIGRELCNGEDLQLEQGASITIVLESGETRFISSSQRFSASAGREPGNGVAAVRALVADDDKSSAPGATRAPAEGECDAIVSAPDIRTAALLADAVPSCRTIARERIELLLATETPLHIRLSFAEAVETADRHVNATTNLPSAVMCAAKKSRREAWISGAAPNDPRLTSAGVATQIAPDPQGRKSWRASSVACVSIYRANWPLVADRLAAGGRFGKLSDLSQWLQASGIKSVQSQLEL